MMWFLLGSSITLNVIMGAVINKICEQVKELQELTNELTESEK